MTYCILKNKLLAIYFSFIQGKKMPIVNKEESGEIDQTKGIIGYHCPSRRYHRNSPDHPS
jgi:hypothetical protein